ncbi:hypothetical protein FB451DRAFT_1195799 [Mycena latifolia]|nr:hypothetical protein FB451DRAFT_1195799 [Mycena latifolia]
MDRHLVGTATAVVIPAPVLPVAIVAGGFGRAWASAVDGGGGAQCGGGGFGVPPRELQEGAEADNVPDRFASGAEVWGRDSLAIPVHGRVILERGQHGDPRPIVRDVVGRWGGCDVPGNVRAAATGVLERDGRDANSGGKVRHRINAGGVAVVGCGKEGLGGVILEDAPKENPSSVKRKGDEGESYGMVKNVVPPTRFQAGRERRSWVSASDTPRTRYTHPQQRAGAQRAGMHIQRAGERCAPARPEVVQRAAAQKDGERGKTACGGGAVAAAVVGLGMNIPLGRGRKGEGVSEAPVAVRRAACPRVVMPVAGAAATAANEGMMVVVLVAEGETWLEGGQWRGGTDSACDGRTRRNGQGGGARVFFSGGGGGDGRGGNVRDGGKEGGSRVNLALGRKLPVVDDSSGLDSGERDLVVGVIVEDDVGSVAERAVCVLGAAERGGGKSSTACCARWGRGAEVREAAGEQLHGVVDGGGGLRGADITAVGVHEGVSGETEEVESRTFLHSDGEVGHHALFYHVHLVVVSRGCTLFHRVHLDEVGEGHESVGGDDFDFVMVEGAGRSGYPETVISDRVAEVGSGGTGWAGAGGLLTLFERVWTWDLGGIKRKVLGVARVCKLKGEEGQRVKPPHGGQHRAERKKESARLLVFATWSLCTLSASTAAKAWKSSEAGKDKEEAAAKCHRGMQDWAEDLKRGAQEPQRERGRCATDRCGEGGSGERKFTDDGGVGSAPRLCDARPTQGDGVAGRGAVPGAGWTVRGGLLEMSGGGSMTARGMR